MSAFREGYESVHAPHDRATAQRRAWKAAESRYGRIVHLCPGEGEAVTPCCGRSPIELPRWHRITLDRSLVTCGENNARGQDDG